MTDYSWMNREPSLRTPEEAELERLEKEYEEIFGERFGYDFLSSPPIEQAIAEAKECIRTKTKQKKQEWTLPEGAVI